jgi:hypothetical protein
MKVLLRNKTTGLYYLTAERWTDDRAMAFDFQTGERALTTGLRSAVVTEVEMIYAFRDPRHDFSVPLCAETMA